MTRRFGIISILLNLLNNAAQTLVDLVRHCFERGLFPDDREHRFRVNRRDYGFIFIIGFINNYVARQKKSDIDVFLQSFVGERRIARAQNHVTPKIHAEFFLQFFI